MKWGDKRSPHKTLQNLRLRFVIRDFVRTEFSLFFKAPISKCKKNNQTHHFKGQEPFLVLDTAQTAQKRLDGVSTAFLQHQIFIFTIKELRHEYLQVIFSL